MQESKQFKVGDRVAYVGFEVFSKETEELAGTIVKVDTSDDNRPYLINFDTEIFTVEDEMRSGHSGGGKCKDGWWVCSEEIKSLEEKQEAKEPQVFKVGDRVRCLKDSMNVVKAGSEGIILYINPSTVGVEFDNLTKGHELEWCAKDGNTNVKCKKGHGWWMLHEEIELITNEEAEEVKEFEAEEEAEVEEALFKVGDRVENVGSIYVPYASEGTVCLVEGNSIGVDWDDFTEGHNFCDRVKCRANHGWWVDAADISLISCTGKSLKAYCSSNPHYETALQPIEFMQANMTHEEFVGFLKGNIIKYTARCGKKDDVDKEVAKIVEYAKWLAKAYKGEIINPRES